MNTIGELEAIVQTLAAGRRRNGRLNCGTIRKQWPMPSCSMKRAAWRRYAPAPRRRG